MEAVDREVIFEKVRSRMLEDATHTFNTLTDKEQRELVVLLMRGQGFYIQESIKLGVKEIALPGLGTFLYNPLKKLAYNIHKKYRETLYDFEIKQLIKEKLVDYIKEKGNPMVRTRGALYEIESLDFD